MEKILLISLIICMIKYYIFSTNVVWEYLSVIAKFSNNQKYKMFFYGILLVDSAKNEKNYLIYINSIYNNFLTRLLSCPICTGFWMSVIGSLFIGNIFLFATIAYISLFFYFILKILTNRSSNI